MNFEKSDEIFEERSKLYNKYCDDGGVIFKINTDQYYQNLIKNLCELYIKENLYYIYHDPSFFEKNINDLESEILSLPNITPGGAIYPKRESCATYNLLCKYLFQAYSVFFNYVESADLPTVRFKSGRKKGYPYRPYATNKIHSDAWVGQYGDAILSYGVWGDTEKTGVEFYLPEKVTSNFFEKINNYDQGVIRYRGFNYLTKLEIGKAIIFDHLVLHKTMDNEDGGPRISIDLGIVMDCDSKTKFRSVKKADRKRYNYNDMKLLKQLGINQVAFNSESIEDTIKILESGKQPLKTHLVKIKDKKII